MSLLTPGAELVPGYILEKRLGRGGFGEVWRAAAPGGFHIAMKFISTKDNEGTIELRALEIIRNIRHPHLLDVQFAVQRDGWLIIAMPLCDRSLADRLTECRQNGLTGIPVPELLGYMKECAKAIDFLNERRHRTPDGAVIGIQHRDIKPHNIFLVGESARIADFGLVKALESSTASHTSGMTPHYAAPEMFKKSIAKTSDQYSLAIAYYHLRTGQLPFTGTSHEIMYGHLEREPDLSALPDPERSVIARALSKPPTARWRNCQEMVVHLERAAKPLNTTDKTTKDAHVRMIPSPRRKSRPSPGAPSSGPAVGDARPRGAHAVVTRPPQMAQPAAGAGRQEHETAQGDDETSRAGAAAELDSILSPKLIWLIVASACGVALILIVALALVLPGNLSINPDANHQTAAKEAKQIPAGKVVTNSIGMKLAYIPKGEFLMGGKSTAQDVQRDFNVPDGTALRSEFPVHRVRITKPFYLSVHEVTVGQFRQFVNAANYTTEAEKNGKGGFGFDQNVVLQHERFNWEFNGAENRDNHPVSNVSWFDASEFCLWLSRKENARYRLPTEAEWEYACRAGATTRYYNGSDDEGVVEIANVKDASFHNHFDRLGRPPEFRPFDGAVHASEVGLYRPNAFGLHDMLGNLQEWCADWYDVGYYASCGAIAEDPQGPSSGEHRVLRGGSFLTSRASVRCAARGAGVPNSFHLYVGFRVAKEVSN